jgi:hypothetical protein
MSIDKNFHRKKIKPDVFECRGKRREEIAYDFATSTKTFASGRLVDPLTRKPIDQEPPKLGTKTVKSFANGVQVDLFNGTPLNNEPNDPLPEI